MSKKFRSQASSARAASATTTFGAASSGFGNQSAFQTTQSSLSYVTESPDLSRINDSNLVVSFRNLGKKDSTTKAKALEDLQDQLFSSSEVVIDSALLEVWTALYPRTAIDNARRVRQLAHTLQGSLTKAAGKQIVPHLPKAIGSWLAGTYDSDRIPAKAAQDSLSASFATEDKRKAIWKIYRSAIVEYINDAILMQTPQTLSDERTTSPDDAEAKHVRVVGSGMQMLARLIQESSNQLDDLVDLVSNKKLWEYAHNKDPFLRRGACSLAITCSAKMPNVLDWPVMSTSFLAKGLHTSQLGSMRQYLEALVTLTKVRPEIWVEDYQAKTAVAKRLHHFLRLGSQRGPEGCWVLLGTLVKTMPNTAWRSNESSSEEVTTVECNALLDSLFAGVTHADEPRQNAPMAWATYVDVCHWAIRLVNSSPADIMTQHLNPLLEQYVSQSAEKSQWNLPKQSAGSICSKALLEFMLQAPEVFNHLWFTVTLSVIDNMKLSKNESSKDFAASQDSVIACGNRYNNLRQSCLSQCKDLGNAETILKSIQRHDEAIIGSSIELLKSRNGMPYGAAGVLYSLLQQPDVSTEQSSLKDFVQNDLPSLLQSPSTERLVLICLKVNKPLLSSYLPTLAESAMSNSYSAAALRAFLANASDADLDEGITRTCRDQMGNGPASKGTAELMLGILSNSSLSSSPLQEAAYAQILQGLEVDRPKDEQVASLELVDRCLGHPASSANVVDDPFGAKLLSALILLNEHKDLEVADRAANLASKLRALSMKIGASPGANTVITQQLNGEGVPIPILALTDLGKDQLQAANDNLDIILPSDAQWKAALQPHLLHNRPVSLAITSPLQGAVYALEVGNSRTTRTSILRDADDFSLAVRLTFYSTKVLSSAVLASQSSSSSLEAIFIHLPVALHLVNEKLTIDSANDMWINSSPEVVEEMSNLVAEGKRLLHSFMERDATAVADIGTDSSRNFLAQWISLGHDLRGLNPESYCAAHAFVEVMEMAAELFGSARLSEAFTEDTKKVHRSGELMQAAGLVVAMRDHLNASATGTRLCNELIADATEMRELSNSVSCLRPLVLLNILLGGEGDMLTAIPTQRLVFLMKNLLRLLMEHDQTQSSGEVLKLLTVVLEYVQDIYGEHWEQMIELEIKIWSTDLDVVADLPILHASLKTYAKLKALKSREDVNDDLLDAWNLKLPDMQSALLQCLHLFLVPSGAADLPRQVTTELLQRQLADYKPTKVENIWFELLNSEDDAVQATAFQLLHSAIPNEQEELSVELALSQVSVELPDALLPMLLDSPDTENLSTTKRYFFSWVLVFDHFQNASYKLQEAYTAVIKRENILDRLLDLICDIVRVTSGRPVDASKYQIENLQDHNMEGEIQSLAIHLYYKSLLHLPSIVKAWFMSQKNRIKYPLEAWTQKHISPLIMQASVSSVTQWSSTQSQDSDDRPVSVKSSPRGTEIVASIEVDPESPPIALSISLPATYPLESPSVNSVTRVGVSEKKWQSWLRTIQIIIFSSGSIVEGLVAFRRNAQGALLGQTECAICYSIIGTDMKTPDKKCGTCKNTFHGVCLFRWFKSSNSSSCPLCRNNFMYA